MIALEFWYMFPVGVVIATIAMMSGVGGATMFTPLFLLVLHLEPAAALASGLFIEVFGFTSGIVGYAQKRLINYSLAKRILPFTLAGTLIGVGLSLVIPKGSIELILAAILGYVSIQFLRSKKKCEPTMWSHSGTDPTHAPPQAALSWLQRIAFMFGGGLFGFSSSGLGEVNEYVFLERLGLKPGNASGTSVLIIAISAMIAATFHSTILFLGNTPEVFSTVISLVAFTVPGVVIGAQIGVHLASRISLARLEVALGVLYGSLSLILISSSWW